MQVAPKFLNKLLASARLDLGSCRVASGSVEGSNRGASEVGEQSLVSEAKELTIA